MTRKSPRELERTLEALSDDVEAAPETDPDRVDLTDEQAAAIRAVGRYRREAYPNGDAPEREVVIQEALEEIGPEHVEALNELRHT